MQTVPAAVTEVIHSGESQGVNVVKGLSVVPYSVIPFRNIFRSVRYTVIVD